MKIIEKQEGKHITLRSGDIVKLEGLNYSGKYHAMVTSICKEEGLRLVLLCEDFEGKVLTVDGKYIIDKTATIGDVVLECYKIIGHTPYNKVEITLN